MSPSSRREFLQRTAALAASHLTNVAKPDGPISHFPSKPCERLAVTSWPFRAYIESPTNRWRDRRRPGMDVKDFPALIAEKFGVFNVNPLADHLSSTEPAYLAAFREAAAKVHSHVVDLGLDGRDFCSSDPTMRDLALSFGRSWIDRAYEIGSPSVRQHLKLNARERPDRERAAKNLGRLAEYGAKRNVVVNLENDDPIAEDPFFIVDVIKKVDNPYLRALPDFGNCLEVHSEEYNERAISTMLPHAWNMCHVKGAVQSDDGRLHTVDLSRLFAIVKANAYAGYFSMEFDLSWGDPFEGTKKLIRATLEYLA